MKYFLPLLLLATWLYGASQQIEVKADSFEADEKKLISIFKGSVFIKKGEDEIKADLLKINFDKKNRPIKYEATGNVRFKIKTDSQRFKGRSNIIVYEPVDKKYRAYGNVQITETIKNQKLNGERIIIDRVSGKTKISGTKKQPVKFIFTVDE
jgi:lipopolysaccharide export system protein LptA